MAIAMGIGLQLRSSGSNGASRLDLDAWLTPHLPRRADVPHLRRDYMRAVAFYPPCWVHVCSERWRERLGSVDAEPGPSGDARGVRRLDDARFHRFISGPTIRVCHSCGPGAHPRALAYTLAHAVLRGTHGGRVGPSLRRCCRSSPPCEPHPPCDPLRPVRQRSQRPCWLAQAEPPRPPSAQARDGVGDSRVDEHRKGN